ncbi:MAG: hypothetical protein Q8N81_04220, partial [bacterium]|nr:hypothetical protein [bacterium]
MGKTAEIKRQPDDGGQLEAAETPLEREGREMPEYDEEALGEMIDQAHAEVEADLHGIPQKVDEQIREISKMEGMDSQKAESVFSTGGFGKKIGSLLENIAVLARNAKGRIQSLVSGQTRSNRSEDAIQPQLTEVAQVELPVEKQADTKPEAEITVPEQVEAKETPEQKDLREHLEKEVFSKFGLTVEDEQRALAEAPEGEREILRRSFENTRKSLETFYNTQVIEGVIDGHAVERAQKQLTYDTLAPLLESSLAEIKPKLAELGVDISMSSLGFGPETADRDDLGSTLHDLDRQIEFIIRDRVYQQIGDALTQAGEYQGVTIVTEEQMRDAEFMEQRSQQITRLQNQATSEALGSVGFSDWMYRTRAKLDEP